MAVDGVYNVEMKTQMGTRPGKLTLKTEGSSLSGTLSAEEGDSPFEGGTVSGGAVEFSVEVTTPMGKIQLGFKGTVSDDTISGQVQAGNFGSFPFEGKRA